MVVKEEIPAPAFKSGAAQKGSSVVAKGGQSSAAPTSPVTEDEIRKVLLSSVTITTQELVGQFRSRLRNSDVLFSLFSLSFLHLKNRGLLGKCEQGLSYDIFLLTSPNLDMSLKLILLVVNELDRIHNGINDF